MARQPFIDNQNSDGTDPLTQVQKAFLAIVTESDATIYPWEPSQAETEDYFAQQQQDFPLDNILAAAEVETKSASLFSHLDQCWQSLAQGEIMKQGLIDRFRGVPSAWLDAIATTAQEIHQQGYSLQDKLVNCVQSILSQWSEEDLQVLARPLAYAMRGNEPEEQTFTGVWENLSAVEQARWGLAIAKAALQEMETVNSEQ
jgi:hypothetical protein